MKLDDDQQRALDAIDHQVSPVIVVTGEAGTGKSTVIREASMNCDVTLSALTGRAALNIGGCTVDSLFSYDRTRNETRSNKSLQRNMGSCAETIIIDEASMIGAQMAHYLRNIARMSGKTLVLVGDWAQAPPVKDDWAVGTQLLEEASVFRLGKVHRQDETEYLDALYDVRRGNVSDRVVQTLNRNFPPPPDTPRIFATNRAADTFNREMLIPDGRSISPVFGLRASASAEPAYKKYYDESKLDKIAADSCFAHNDKFRIGAQVVITLNDIPGRQFANGDTGVIIDALISGKSCKELHEEIPPDAPMNDVYTKIVPTELVIKLDRDGREIKLGSRVMKQISPTGKTQHKVSGIPVKLAWGMTIHKTQGMTLDSCMVDMETIRHMPTKHGLAYVALSRTRSLSGLFVRGWRNDAIYCDPIVLPYL